MKDILKEFIEDAIKAKGLEKKIFTEDGSMSKRTFYNVINTQGYTIDTLIQIFDKLKVKVRREGKKIILEM